jgi:hypothetical protein
LLTNPAILSYSLLSVLSNAFNSLTLISFQFGCLKLVFTYTISLFLSLFKYLSILIFAICESICACIPNGMNLVTTASAALY